MKTAIKLLAGGVASAVLLGVLYFLAATGTFDPLGAQAALAAPDNHGLTISIDSPTDHQIVSGPQSLTVKVNDDSKVGSVQYVISFGPNDQTTVTGDGTVTRNYVWDTTKHADSDATITAVAAIKNSADTVKSTPITVKVNNKGGNNAVSSPTKPEVAPLHEVGPNGTGNCVDGNSILKANPHASAVTLKKQFTAWINDHKGDACVASMAAASGVKASQLADYVNKTLFLAQVPKGGLTVQNTYFDHKTGKVVNWKVQTFPAGEWVFFKKNADGTPNFAKPVYKFVCGNVLKPVPPTKQTPPPVKVPPVKTPPTKTPPTTCTSNCTPPPVCTKDCTNTPPPGCVKDCTPPPTCTSNCTPPPPAKCDTPNPHAGEKGYTWDATTCTSSKLPQSDDCMLNGGPNCPPNAVVQNPQDNSTSGINVGNTPGAPTTAPTDTVNPVNNRDNGKVTDKAPNPTTSGSNSGSADGKGTPSGTTTDASGTTGDNSGNGNGHVTDNTEASGGATNSGSVSAPE